MKYRYKSIFHGFLLLIIRKICLWKNVKCKVLHRLDNKDEAYFYYLHNEFENNKES